MNRPGVFRRLFGLSYATKGFADATEAIKHSFITGRPMSVVDTCLLQRAMSVVRGRLDHMDHMKPMTKVALHQPSFDPKIFLARIGEGRSITKYKKEQIVFSQGEPAESVFYIQ